MRTHPRQTWLIPLLAAPLSQVALSPCCTSEVLTWLAPNRDLAASNGTRGLTDDEAWLFLQFSHDYVGLAGAVLGSHLSLRNCLQNAIGHQTLSRP
jgi:hypothetical protein